MKKQSTLIREKGTVIYYVIVDDEVRENIRWREIGKYVDSDHLHLIVTVEMGKRDEGKPAKENKK